MIELPRNLERVLNQHLQRRVRLERAELKAWDVETRVFADKARNAVLHSAPTEWTIEAHARALPKLRHLGRAMGVDLTHRTERAALAAVNVGIADVNRWIDAATRANVPPRVAAKTNAIIRAKARTAEVGAAAGESIGSTLAAVSMQAVGESPITLAATIGKVTIARGEAEGSRVLTTEITAGFDAATGATAAEFGMKLVWDATLDRRVCHRCRALHHKMSDEWPPGTRSPLHPRCRCATMPWHEDWTELLAVLGIEPGQRAGLAGSIEPRLKSF